MDWEKLLCEERRRKSETEKNHRNEFDKDYDRIIYSSSFRRLQDKAQVFPLQENDFVRTRLTHSLEVSALGRSLGQLIAGRIINEKNVQKEVAEKIPSVLAVACLVHDLGNPPFGHFGETVIQKWFENWFNSSNFKDLNKKFMEENKKPIIADEEIIDLINFEGNAQALRILARLQFLNDHYGINFTYGVLATIIKYPWSSDQIDKEKGGFYKKFGYFQSEKNIFNEIKENTGLDGIRHPLTFLLEAADDIAYLAADVEDGVKKGVIPWKLVYANSKSKFDQQYKDMFDYLDKKAEVAKENGVPDLKLIEAQNFRIRVQGEMFKAASNAFMDNYDSIMNGTFDKEILDVSSASELKEFLKDQAKEYVYCNSEVLTLELVGDSVISGLLDLFIDAVTNHNDVFLYKTKREKLYNLISPNFCHVFKLDENGKKRDEGNISLYDKLQLVTDFISGMTDSYAVNLYQKLKGMRLP